MPIEEDFVAFKAWARKLGCPEDKMPTSEGLKIIFRIKQKQVMYDMMKRIVNKNEAKAMKGNIIVSNLNKINGEINLVNSSTLRVELQRYQHTEKLELKINETTDRINESKSKCDSLLTQIKNLNRKKITLKEKLTEAKTRTKIYEIKSINTKKNLEAEKKRYTTLQSLDFMSRLPNDKNNYVLNRKELRQLIQQCFKFVHSSEVNQQNFLDFYSEKLGDVPKHMIWKILMEILDENIKILENLVNQPPIMNEEKEEALLKQGLAKCYAQHVIFGLDGRKIDNEMMIVQKTYAKEVERFFKLISTQLRRTHNGDIDNELVVRYIETLVSKMYVKVQIEFVQNHIKLLENQNTQAANHLSENRISVEHYTSLYEDINNFCDKIHTNILNSSSIKDKLFHTQKMIQRCVEAGKLGRINLNETLDAFAANESVLCSTKFGLDLERHQKIPDISIAIPNQIPPAISEVQLFHTIPIYKLKKVTPKLDFHLRSMIQNVVGNETMEDGNYNYLTGVGAQTESNRLKSIGEMLKNVSKMIHLDDVHVVDADEIILKQLFGHQKETFAEIIDKMHALVESMDHFNADTERLMKFVEDTPLRKYISPKHLFNGHPYTYYEKQFKMYYRIVKDGNMIAGAGSVAVAGGVTSNASKLSK